MTILNFEFGQFRLSNVISGLFNCIQYLKLTWQRDSPEKQNDEYDIWKRGREIDDLSRALDPFDETQTDDDPRGQQTQGQMPTHGAHGVDAGRFVKHHAEVVFFGS